MHTNAKEFLLTCTSMCQSMILINHDESLLLSASNLTVDIEASSLQRWPYGAFLITWRIPKSTWVPTRSHARPRLDDLLYDFGYLNFMKHPYLVDGWETLRVSKYLLGSPLNREYIGNTGALNAPFIAPSIHH